MSKKCAICGRRLTNYNNEGVCSICRKRAKSVINIHSKKRENDYDMYDSLKELESNVLEYGNCLLQDNIKIRDIAFSLLSIIETVDCITKQCDLNLNLYKDKFKEVIENDKK